MKRIITKITNPALPKLTRVAAYARISCVNDDMLHSLSRQISYYSNYIQSRRDWQYAGVYADVYADRTTGTTANRPQFQQLLEDCRNGAVDMVITKSISRMARNSTSSKRCE